MVEAGTATAMAGLLPELPASWQGLWERTLLERYSPGTLTSDRPARVFWLQTALWHADIRIPLERPDFSGTGSLEECDDQQLAFIAGQEAFCGVTRVEGVICTWNRLFDLKPDTALDVARMEFKSDELIHETGIAESYLEHWSLVAGSRDSGPVEFRVARGTLWLRAGKWAVAVTPRGPAPAGIDIYTAVEDLPRDELFWRASLGVTLCENTGGEWIARLSTHPWLEGNILSAPQNASDPAPGPLRASEVACA